MKKFSAFVLLFSISFLLLSNHVLAAEFSQAFVRLNSNKPSAPLSGTVCATPSGAGAGVENKVLITFPNDFTINSNTSNFTTNTSNLPTGATAWPGIGASATSINSKTVTLSSGDLTDGGALYCFNFTANSSTTGSLGNKPGNLTTTNSSNTTVDSSDFGLSIVSSDQITVTATVPADPLDFTHSLTKITSANSYLPDNRIDYQINYGSLLSTNTDLVIEASWTKGTVEGDSVPSIDILNYYSGSATNAYGSTPPVIDTVNRKITWTISIFPANLLNQNVKFSLQTTSSYSPSVKSSFTVSARLLPPGTATTYSQITSYLDPNTGSSSTTTDTTTSTSTTTSSTSTGQTTPTQSPINQVNINSISSSTSSISVTTNDITSVEITYGNNLNSLNQNVSSLNSNSHLIKLEELEPNTKYYFRIITTDSSGNKTTSDIYTFVTAKDSTPLLADTLTLVATSDNTIISSLIQGNNSLVIPVDSIFQFKFAMQERASAKDIQADIKNENVLGVFSFLNSEDSVSQSVSLIETQNGIYSGNLKTYPTPGNYSLTAKISDNNGNITEQKIADVKVIDKFSVISENDDNPIEGARVYLYLFSPSTKTYQEIPTSAITDGNPIFTNRNGQLDLVLPQGKYRAEITSLGYKDKSVDFEIGPEKGQHFPVVKLEYSGLSPISLFTYYRTALNDVFVYNTRSYYENLTGSSRFFDLIALLSLGALVAITLFAFSKRHHIPLTHIPSYFYYLVDKRDRNDRYVHGVIYDEEGKPIKSANVYLMDKNDEKIISHKKTNKYGEFFFRKGKIGKNKPQYLVLAMAKGYTNSPVFQYHEKAHLKFKITLKKEEEGLHIFGRLVNYLTIATGLSFEVLLVISFAFELLFLNSFGVAKTLPFLLITILNLALWILHTHNKSQTKIV